LRWGEFAPVLDGAVPEEECNNGPNPTRKKVEENPREEEGPLALAPPISTGAFTSSFLRAYRPRGVWGAERRKKRTAGKKVWKTFQRHWEPKKKKIGSNSSGYKRGYRLLPPTPPFIS